MSGPYCPTLSTPSTIHFQLLQLFAFYSFLSSTLSTPLTIRFQLPQLYAFHSLNSTLSTPSTLHFPFHHLYTLSTPLTMLSSDTLSTPSSFAHSTPLNHSFQLPQLRFQLSQPFRNAFRGINRVLISVSIFPFKLSLAS